MSKKEFLTCSQTRPVSLGSRLKGAAARCSARRARPSHVCEPSGIFSDVHAAGENDFYFLCACERKLCEAFIRQSDTARWDDPTGRFFRFVIAPLRMQQGSLTCHCEPCAARRGNLAVPGWIMGKLSAKSQLPSRDSHVASLLGMTSRRCVSFEQWPVLIGSACRALSVTFGDSSPRGRAKGASRLAMTNLGALRRRMCAAKIARLHGAQGAPLHFSLARRPCAASAAAGPVGTVSHCTADLFGSAALRRARLSVPLQ